MIRRLGLVVLASLALAACGSISASTALSRWSKNSDLPSTISSLTLDARHALTVLERAHSTALQLHTVCAVLDLETVQANAALPTPDTQTTNLLSAGYTDLGSGANECYVSQGSPAKQAKAENYLHHAGSELAEAQARVNAVTGSS